MNICFSQPTRMSLACNFDANSRFESCLRSRAEKYRGTLVGFRMKIKYFSRTRSNPPICWIYWFPSPTLADFAITDTILSILSRCISLEFVKVSRSVEIISLDKSTSQALVRQPIVINKLQHFHGFFVSIITYMWMSKSLLKSPKSI